MIWFHCGSACDKWCKAPLGFNEIKHCVKCSCGSPMFLNRVSEPREIYASNPEEFETTGTLMKLPKV